MSTYSALFARTFLIGVAVAAPVGAMGVLCIQRTLSRGWRTGMATGLGVATADGLYAALAAFGISALSGALVTWQVPLRLLGGLVLIGLGLRAALAPQQACDAQSVTNHTSLDTTGALALYMSAVGLTLTNPMTIMAFGAIFAGAGLSAQAGASSAMVATVGVTTGSLAWWAILVTGVALARHTVSGRALGAINVVSGVVVAGFGVLAIASVVFGWG